MMKRVFNRLGLFLSCGLLTLLAVYVGHDGRAGVGDAALVETAAAAPTTACELRLSAPYRVYLPAVTQNNGQPTGGGVGNNPLPPPTAVAATPPIDFLAIRSQLQAQGKDLAFNKIGFHVGPGGNITGLENWMRALDSACVPFFLKSADSGGPLWVAQEIMKASGVPHTLVFRRTVPYAGAAPIGSPDVPDYNLPPAEAALQHWEWHKAGFPPELDPNYVWFETINEVDKNRAEWLGQFALETAKLTLAQGYKWAAFGWSAGEPEPYQWETPAMLAFLRLAGENPDKLAIALHEYSYRANDVGYLYPYLMGRVQTLFDICDKHGIPRPTILITEWGWEYNNVPSAADAMNDVAWAARMYAAYPEIKGAALWYLGPGFGGIANQAQQFILPMQQYSLGNYFIIQQGQGAIDPALFQP